MLHPGTDDAHRRQVSLADQAGGADLLGPYLDLGQGGRQIGAADGEADVGGPVLAGVLDDGVHADPGLGQGFKQGGGHAGTVRNAAHGDLGHVGGAGYTRYFDSVFHLFLVRVAVYQCSRSMVETGSHVYGHFENRSQFDGPRVHLGPVVGQFQHLLIADLVQLPGLWDDLGVRGVDAVHVGVYLAPVGLQRRRQGHRRGIGAPAPQGGYVLVFGDPLEPRHHDDAALCQLFLHPGRVHPVDPGPAVAGVRMDPRLGTGEAHRLLTQVPQSHGQQRAGDQLAGGEQQVQLPGIGMVGNRMGQLDQLVGGVAHGGNHGHHAGPALSHLGDAAGHVLDHRGVAHG